MAQPGRNLDVYAADLNRVEVLAGPQGTLFGASSQAGTVRLITNKPDPTGAYGKVKVGFSTMNEGGTNNNFEAMYNLPISDNITFVVLFTAMTRAVIIDNVHGTRTLKRVHDSALKGLCVVMEFLLVQTVLVSRQRRGTPL